MTQRLRGARRPSLQLDAELVTRMRQRDPAALEQFYGRWAPMVKPFALHLVGDAESADDVVAETFWRAWRDADRYDSARGEVATWLFTIGRGRALMHLRARRRRREERLPVTEFRELRTAATDPATDAEAADARTRVIGAIAQLPAEQRQAVDLAYFHGFSQREIADRIEQPLGTVKTRTRLAFNKLRALLADLGDRNA